MLVQITVQPIQEPISIADPACGSGRFFIAAQPLAPNATFYGTDRDLTCVHMTALNMLMRNANAFIVHGNTLSMECFGGYATCSTALGGVMRLLDAATAKAILTTVSRQIAEHPPGPIAPRPTQSASAPPKPTDTPAFTQDKKGQLGFDF